MSSFLLAKILNKHKGLSFLLVYLIKKLNFFLDILGYKDYIINQVQRIKQTPGNIKKKENKMTDTIKTRLELTLEQAIKHAKKWGGYIAQTEKGTYWYSYAHTRTDILNDLKVSFECGGWKEWSKCA